MMDKDRPRLGGILRRGGALALALVSLWTLSLCTDLSALPSRALEGTERASFALTLLSGQLAGGQDPDGLLPAARLLLSRAPVLRCSLPLAARLLEQEEEQAPAQTLLPPEPVDQDGRSEADSEPELDYADYDSQVLEYTSLGKEGSGYLQVNGVYLYNRTQLELELEDVAALAAAQPDLELEQAADGPQILIYHTHGTEAYTPQGEDRYVESDPYRTTDCTQNVVRVGEEMAQVFRDNGLSVIHDTQLYDYPSYNEAYNNSQAALEQWLEEYPSIRIALDVHRDALVSADGAVYKLMAQEDQGKMAQVMLVVGSSDGGAPHPNWRENLTLALQVQQALCRDYHQLARPVVLRSSRFNQHLSTGALLVEVGGHGNSLQEAITAARCFARTASRVFLES